MIRSKLKNKTVSSSALATNRFILLATMAGAMVCAFAFDRISKVWILAHVVPGQTCSFIPGLLQLELVRNTGAAWSLGRDNAGLMTTVACLYTFGFLIWGLNRWRTAGGSAWLERIGTGLVVGASCGNLYERFTAGSVTDFLKFAFIDFPIFNVADALIDAGVVLILVQFLFLENKQHAASSAPLAASDVPLSGNQNPDKIDGING